MCIRDRRMFECMTCHTRKGFIGTEMPVSKCSCGGCVWSPCAFYQEKKTKGPELVITPQSEHVLYGFDIKQKADWIVCWPLIFDLLGWHESTQNGLEHFRVFYLESYPQIPLPSYWIVFTECRVSFIRMNCSFFRIRGKSKVKQPRRRYMKNRYIRSSTWHTLPEWKRWVEAALQRIHPQPCTVKRHAVGIALLLPGTAERRCAADKWVERCAI